MFVCVCVRPYELWRNILLIKIRPTRTKYKKEDDDGDGDDYHDYVDEEEKTNKQTNFSSISFHLKDSF